MSQSHLLQGIDAGWTLFLDRDGVLNTRIVDDYVRTWADWQWEEGALEALAALRKRFGRLVVVTNQRGIARGLYTERDLQGIHRQMLAEAKAAGGAIDAVYHCPHDRDAGCDCRKPRPGMILRAASELKGIDLRRSLLVGDSLSDMEAAQAAGMPAVFIGKMRKELPANVLTAMPDLATFARLFD